LGVTRELKHRVWGLSLSRCIWCAPRCGTRTLLAGSGCLPVGDEATVGVLGLLGERSLLGSAVCRAPWVRVQRLALLSVGAGA
jgi:hypothetical protein